MILLGLETFFFLILSEFWKFANAAGLKGRGASSFTDRKGEAGGLEGRRWESREVGGKEASREGCSRGPP